MSAATTDAGPQSSHDSKDMAMMVASSPIAQSDKEAQKEAVAAAMGVPYEAPPSKLELKEQAKEVEAMHGKGGTYGASGMGSHIKGPSMAGYPAPASASSRSAGRESYNTSHRGAGQRQ